MMEAVELDMALAVDKWIGTDFGAMVAGDIAGVA